MPSSLYRLLFCCCILFFSAADRIAAQVQFWNLADQEDAIFLQARKGQHITQARLYRVDERGRLIDTTGPDEIRRYAADGQLTSQYVYKYNWSNRKRELLKADSFAYNNNGRLVTYLGYEGPYRKPVYETQVKFNSKDMPARQDHYSTSGYERQPDHADVFEYDAKNQPKKITTTSSMGKNFNSSRLFFFDNKGQLTRNQFITSSGTITEQLTRNAGGQLLTYQQLYGKEVQKTVQYTYDALGRLTKKQTTTSSGYDDFTEYSYEGNNPLPARTYLQYSGYNGKNDRRHEYTMWVYEK
jgi:hypothetical protein